MRKIGLWTTTILFIAGCAQRAYRPTPIPQIPTPGVYHRIEKGETLWRIARAYDVEVEKIRSYNNIEDVRELKVGSLIFIPGAKKRLSVPPSLLSDEVGKEGFIWPARGKIVSRFTTSGENISKGIDIALPLGTEIKAAKSGIVKYSDVLRGYGKIIIVDHQDGFSTVYAHNSKNMVKENDFVLGGEVIALSGDTGCCSGPVLHFQIRKGEVPQDPLFYLPR